MSKFDRLLDEPNWKDRAIKAEATIAELRKHAKHFDRCDNEWDLLDPKCTCGLDELLDTPQESE